MWDIFIFQEHVQMDRPGKSALDDLDAEDKAFDRPWPHHHSWNDVCDGTSYTDELSDIMKVGIW